MNWTKRNEKLPGKKKKYPVIIDCNGQLKEGYCTYKPKQQKFHFDMPHINWKVIAWFDLPDYENA